MQNFTHNFRPIDPANLREGIDGDIGVHCDLGSQVPEFVGHLDGRLGGDERAPYLRPQFGEGQCAIRRADHAAAAGDRWNTVPALDLRKVSVRHFGSLSEGDPLRGSEGGEVIMKFHGEILSHAAKQNTRTFAFGDLSQNANVPVKVRSMDRHEIRRANLQIIFQMLGGRGGKTKLASLLGIKPSRITQWIMTGEGSRKISDESCRDLEKLPALRVHGISEGWMDEPHADAVRSNGSTYPARMVRVITWAQAGEAREMETAVNIVDWDESSTGEWISVYSPAAGSRTFGLRVRDDSMVNPMGDRSYPVGCLIVVDPDRAAKPGDRVVVRLANAPEAIFKQFEFDGLQRWLKPLNDRYPMMAMPVDAEIVGVVVQMTREE